MRTLRQLLFVLPILLVVGPSACGTPESPDSEVVEVTVPPAASFRQVTDSLEARGLVAYPRFFRLLARVRGDDRRVHAGTYRFEEGSNWLELLDTLVEGRVETLAVTIPEGFTLEQMAPRLAHIVEGDEEVVLARLHEESAAERLGVPGPSLEGYLFPDTYRFAPSVSLDAVLSTLVGRYRLLWNEEREVRAEELGMSEAEVVTLASIIEAEARRGTEMRIISSVFHNRLRIGMPLQADPTIQYALGERQQRLLYSHIDSVADHPYNTYTHPGLPPGPIGAPGEAALDATLDPAETEYLYFVARPDGSHIFSRTLAEHNRARVESRREWDRMGSSPGG